MSGHRRRNSWGSVFSFDGLRSLSRAATPSTLQRSATDPVLGVPYHEHKVASQQVQKQKTSTSTSLRMRLRDASGKASAKLKSLGLKKPSRALEKLPERAPEQEIAVALDQIATKPRKQDKEDLIDLRHARSAPNILRPRINPLRCHPDVLALTERPVFTIPPVPRIEVSQDDEIDNEDDNDIYLDYLQDAVIYSPSIGDLNSYARQTPSPARSSYESPQSTIDKVDASVCLITPTRAPLNDSYRSKDTSSLTRSMTGLNFRENMSGLYHKATGYNKLTEPQEKPFEKIGVAGLLKDIDPNALSQPETPEKHGLFARLGSKKDLLTPLKTSKSIAALNTSHYASEKTVLADESLHQHTPKNPSPLRRVYSSDSLTSLEYEQLKQWM